LPEKTKSAKRAMQPDDILRIRWVTDPQISPDGTQVAYVVTTLDAEKNEYRSRISLVPAAGGESVRLTNGPKRDTGPRWSPDGRHLAFLSERPNAGQADEKEKAQVWVIDAGGGEAWRLTNLPDGVASPPAWSPDGKRVAFTSRMDIAPAEKGPDGKPYPKVRKITTLKYKSNGEGLVDDKRSHIFVADVDFDGRSLARAAQLTRGDYNNGPPVWSPDGKRIAFASARHATRDRDNASDIWTLDVPKGGEKAAAPRRLTRTLGPSTSPAWSPDGRQVAYLGHRFKKTAPGRHFRLWTVPANGRGEPVCLSESVDRNCNSGVEPMWSGDGKTLLFGVLDGGDCHVYQTPVGKPAPAPVLSGERQITAARAANGSLAFLATDPTHPAEVFACSADGSAERRISRENDAWLAEVQLAPREAIKAVSADGTAVQAWVIRPPGLNGRAPCLVNVHGGPKTQYGSNFFDEFQVYAGAGYAVVYGNPRGSDGYSEDWAMAVVRAWGDKDWADVTAIADAAEALPFVDAERIGIMGGSYGGFMASWAVGHSDRFRAACSERAVNNAYSMVGTSDIGFSFQIDQVGALPYKDPLRFLRMSPIDYAANIRTPLLILHSENDLRCPIEQAEQLYVALKLQRKPVEFWRFPEDNHEMSRSGKPRNRLKRFEVILSWFDRHLKTSSRPSGRTKSRAR
jgi:dipeptidyl aminopeptidase/acylaminoacyl peptidase